MALTDIQLKTLKPRVKPYKVTDRDALYIDVLPSGTKTWRFQYWLNGKREKITLGTYPAIGLADARILRNEAAKLVARGDSPAKDKQRRKDQQRVEAARSITCRQLGQRWIEEEVRHKSANWLYSVNNWLKGDVYPAIGELSPQVINPEHVRSIIAKVVGRGSPTSAQKILMICKQLFDYGVDKGELSVNPCARIKAVSAPATQSHRPLNTEEIGPFLSALEAVDTHPRNKLAIRMMVLTFTRKDELRLAKWSEFDLDNAVWEIPAHRMKMGRAHRVFLSRQVLELLSLIKPLSHSAELLFPGERGLSKPIGHTTINSVIDRIDIAGGRFVPHGFRATASSALNEMGFRADVIERQLAHVDGNKSRAVYNKAEYVEARREMMQHWADYIDGLQGGSNVIQLRARNSA